MLELAVLDAAAGLPRLVAADAEVVIREGDYSERLLILERGAVAVSREGVHIATVDEPGAVFGEVSFLLKSAATASVRAVGECTFRTTNDPQTFLTEQPVVAIAVASLLARRLDLLTRYLVDVREQYADRGDHLGLVDLVLESLSHSQGAAAEPGSDRETEAPY